MHALMPFAWLLMLPALAAQTYVVDAAGGVGVQFTSIATAVAAVPDGSTLIVRPGTYDGFTIDGRGIAVLGSPGTDMVGGVINVQNTSANQTVTLRGLRFQAGTVACTDCIGAVLLDTVTFSYPTLSYFTLDLTNCEQVFATDCIFSGIHFTSPHWPGISATNSRLVLVDSEVSSNVSACLVATASDIQVVSSSFLPFAQIHPTIEADSTSTLRMLGSTRVHTNSQPAIVGGNFRLGPQVAFTGTSSTPSQPTSTTSVSDDSVTVTGGGLGSNVAATMSGDAGSLGLLMLGQIGPVLPIPGVVDGWWLDPLVATGVAVGVMSSPVNATLAIPVTPALQGKPFGFQGLSFHPSNGLSVSPPAMFVIR